MCVCVLMNFIKKVFCLFKCVVFGSDSDSDVCDDDGCGVCVGWC